MSIFEGRKPKWPTLRGGQLSAGSVERLQELPGLTMFCKGAHVVHELPSGGMGHGGKRTEYPAVSFELERFVQRNGDAHRYPLYIIVWIGSYKQGSIVHLGWQYPHCDGFCIDRLEAEAFRAFRDIAIAVYGPRDLDSDVDAFIAQKV